MAGIVAPFAGNRIGPAQQLAADDDSAADAGSQNHAKYDLGPHSDTVNGLREGKTIGVVRQPNFSPKY